MKTEYEIYMDFRKAVNQANRLRAIANNMSSLANDSMGGILNSIRSSWSGENADAFVYKGQNIQNRINSTANDLHKVANAIITIATRTRDAELAAIAIAKE